MSESGSEATKADKKREYNRNAQRVFRQRRKEHLSKLEAAQREASTSQNDEVERLRRENFALAQENESLKAAYGSQSSSPGPSISPTEVRGSPAGYITYATAQTPFAPTVGTPFMPTTMSMALSSSIPTPLSSTPLSSTTTDPSSLVVVVPNNIREIRRSLHNMFAPLLDIPVISNPQTHLATLAALAPTLPNVLKPTHVQLTTPHHAYIDMIPSPLLRDRLIAVGPEHANSFLTEVCTIACDIEDTGQMTIWGEDWLNEFSWEFSAPVLERWRGWLLTLEWGQRANFWRRQRGAAILHGYD
ncbi:hypothetical protein PV10_08318 [Exophiala mesophila]|uniref:BZIP domain-containing protein n=1 Tax=Exophiala mesophila TaxID=212818 RepID=A0A0D1Z419_EXOME|nr:uncharacterized protein PV10_08318 [Exophiala mesophila]KIV88654.1 hypothetical protein PV10_08318 [Exophiala mesophila]